MRRRREPTRPNTQRTMLGIDLGNTNCSVAVMRTAGIEVIANEQGSRLTPAVVAFTEAEQLIGEPAKGQSARNGANTVVDIALLLGRSWDDEVLQAALPRWRFKLARAAKGEGVQVDVALKGEQKSFTPPRLASLLLGQLRSTAEALMGGTAKEVVLAVPEGMAEVRRQALQEAAALSGLRVKQTLSAPLAVALLFGSEHEPLEPPAAAVAGEGGAPEAPPPPQQLLVVDVGGSSCCVAVVQRSYTPLQPEAESGGALKVARGGSISEEYVVRACVRDDGLGASAVDGRLRQL